MNWAVIIFYVTGIIIFAIMAIIGYQTHVSDAVLAGVWTIAWLGSALILEYISDKDTKKNEEANSDG